MGNRIIATAVIASMMLLGGCNESATTVSTMSGPGSSAPMILELAPYHQPPIPDFPVPIGFKLDEKVSRDYALAGARLVDHIYKGSESKLAVKRFYERQMPINRWTLTTAMFVQGDVMLDFEKENERCRVMITDGVWGGTKIKVRLWTSAPLTVISPK